MSKEWKIENSTKTTSDELKNLRREMLWKIIDEKWKDDFSLSFWKEWTIDYLLNDWDWKFKLWRFFKKLFLKTFCKSLKELEEITKEIKECDTKNELNELQTSILKTKKEKPQSDNKNNNWSIKNETTPKKTNNNEHYEIDDFNINVSNKYQNLYNQLKWPELPDIEPFACAMKWYEELKWKISNPKYLTVVDFTKPNTQNRFYVINMNNNTVEYATTVWHWIWSWRWKWATSFWNINGSNKTSLWFLRTASFYENNSKRTRRGLRMQWTEKDNTNNWNAASRWIFMHPWTTYSQWCFTIPKNISTEIMNKVKWDSLLFSYAKSKDYFKKSWYFQTTSDWNITI